MGGQLAKEQEQLKNLNCKSSFKQLIMRVPYSLREGTSKALQEFQQDW